jgi:hypothetical protein
MDETEGDEQGQTLVQTLEAAQISALLVNLEKGSSHD